jgi:hypothetical protein
MHGEIIYNSIAPSTRRAYNYAFNSYKSCLINSLNVSVDHILPMRGEFVKLWLTELMYSNKMTYKSIKNYLSGAITIASESLEGCSAAGKINQLMLPTLKGIKRILGENNSNPRSKTYLTTKVIQTVINSLPTTNNRTYKQKLILAAICTGTYGLMRSGEFLWTGEQIKLLTLGDIIAGDNDRTTIDAVASSTSQIQKMEYYMVKLRQSKADQFKAVVIQICHPVAVEAMKEYLCVHPNRHQSSAVFINQNGSILSRYQCMLQVRSLLMNAQVENALAFTGHSFRRGGAQSLMDKGFSTEIIKKMGRWKSEAHSAYTVDTFDSLKAINNSM